MYISGKKNYLELKVPQHHMFKQKTMFFFFFLFPAETEQSAELKETFNNYLRWHPIIFPKQKTAAQEKRKITVADARNLLFPKTRKLLLTVSHCIEPNSKLIKGHCIGSKWWYADKAN